MRIQSSFVRYYAIIRIPECKAFASDLLNRTELVTKTSSKSQPQIISPIEAPHGKSLQVLWLFHEWVETRRGFGDGQTVLDRATPVRCEVGTTTTLPRSFRVLYSFVYTPESLHLRVYLLTGNSKTGVHRNVAHPFCHYSVFEINTLS